MDSRQQHPNSSLQQAAHHQQQHPHHPTQQQQQQQQRGGVPSSSLAYAAVAGSAGGGGQPQQQQQHPQQVQQQAWQPGGGVAAPPPRGGPQQQAVPAQGVVVPPPPQAQQVVQPPQPPPPPQPQQQPQQQQQQAQMQYQPHPVGGYYAQIHAAAMRGPHPGQQQQGPPPHGWQPAMATYGGVVPPPHSQQAQHPGHHPQYGGGPPGGPRPGPPPPGAPVGYASGGGPPPSSTAGGYTAAGVAGAVPASSGGGAGSGLSATAGAYKPRSRKVLTITDKDGNVIELPSKATKSPGGGTTGGAGASSLAAAAAAERKESAAEREKQEAAADAGAKLRAAVERAIMGDKTGEKERAAAEKAAAEKKKAEEEEAARKKKAAEEEERMRKAAEEEAKRKAEEEERKRKEEERLAAEKAERERVARLKAEEEARLAEERRKEEERLAAEKAERERIAKLKAEEEARLAEERRMEEMRMAEQRRMAKLRAEEEAKLKSEEAARAEADRAGKPVDSLQSRLEKMAATPSEVPLAPAPAAPSSGGPSLRPGAGGLRPGAPGLRPGGLRPGAPAASGVPASSSTPAGGASLRPGAPLRPGGAVVKGAPGAASSVKKRIVYTKHELLRYKDCAYCCSQPDDLPDQTVRAGGGPSGRPAGPQRGTSGNQWQRGTSTPQSNGREAGGGRRQSQGGGGQWDRGKAMPPPPKDRGGRGGGRGGGPRGGRNYDPEPLFDGPVKPLEKTGNRWRPTPDTSVVAAAEKKVMSILNKISKSNFDKLTLQICDIPIPSYEVLTMMIHRVFEKAIDEPSFGDMYADLCVRLSKNVSPDSFLHTIKQTEEDGSVRYRWSANVGTSDAEIVGPLESPKECLRVALDPENAPEPSPRGDRTLTLVDILISQGTFIKIMKDEDGDGDANFYVVFFDVEDAKECGQELSNEEDVFGSEAECFNHAKKMNSFKRSLLNKCEDEFNKQDIYEDWKRDKKQYESKKSTMTAAERAEKEEEFEFARMKIKKQMLGNIRFIGELYKKGMLKEGIMHVCILSLMKLEEVKDRNGNKILKPMDDDDMDEEDHEALCQLFTTIGQTIDNPKSKHVINTYFTKMQAMSNDKRLNSRPRFMYKDLIDLRKNHWRARRQEEKAKTLDQIRKDAAREQQQQQSGGAFRGPGGPGGDRRDSTSRQPRGGDYRGDRRDDRRDDRRGGGGGGGGGSFSGGGARGSPPSPYMGRQGTADKRRASQPREVLQSDGFTQVIARGGRATSPPVASSRGARGASRDAPSQVGKKAAAVENKGAPTPPSLSPQKLETRIKSIRSEYIMDPSNHEELFLSVAELSGTPDAEQILAAKNSEAVLDCKDSERPLIIQMLVALAEKGWLKTIHFEEGIGGLGELIEFIEDMKIDIPKVYEYLGELLSALLKVQALRISWICDQCRKHEQKVYSENVISHAVDAARRNFDDATAKNMFEADSAALIQLLGADKWNSIIN